MPRRANLSLLAADPVITVAHVVLLVLAGLELFDLGLGRVGRDALRAAQQPTRLRLPTHPHPLARAQQRKVVFRTDVCDKWAPVEGAEVEPDERALEDQVHDLRRHRREAGRRLLDLEVHALGPDHQGRVPTIPETLDGRRTDDSVAGNPSDREVSFATLDLCRQQVGHADEPGDELRLGLVVDLLGRADLLDPALAHHRDPVAHRERLFLIVGHEDEGDADLALDALQLELHGLAELEVQRAERLVEQQGARIVHESPRERDPLLLTTGELRGLPLGEVTEADDVEQVGDPGLDLCLRDLLGLEPEGDVVPDRHVGKQGVRLEDRVDVALVRRDLRDVVALEADLTLRRLLEPGDHAQRGGLPAPGRPEHGEELGATDLEVRVVDRDEGTESLDDVVDRDDDVGFAPRVRQRYRLPPSSRAHNHRLP